jgi:glutaredoxin
MKEIKVYGADWCPHTQQAIDLLEELNIPFEYIDVEADPAASEWVKRQNGGKEIKPTVDIDGDVLSGPSAQELEAALA